MLSERFFKIAVATTERDIEVTLYELFETLDLSANCGILDKLSILGQNLETADLEIKPDLSRGDLDTIRLLRRVRKFSDCDDIRELILAGENAFLEFKSSLYFDHNRFLAKPSTAIKDLESDGVITSALKTIAAFLNSSGGTLLVGVKDSGDVCGIAHDFHFCKSKTIDGWELKLRDLVKSRFYEGDLVNNYITTAYTEIDELRVCKIVASARSKLSFLSVSGGRYALYIRQGNRTIEIGIEKVEEIIVGRSVSAQSRRIG